MTTPPYAVREAWVRFKEQALTSGEAPSDAYALAAIEKWASHEAGSRGGPARPLREALAASVAGAALVDAAIEKLAAEGRYTAEEREFLLDVNAEAAIRDLRGLLKTSSAFGDALRSPTARGALIGTAIGGGVGAWKDDDNRLRGALTYALPGAAIGSVVGHGYGTWAKARQLAGEEQARRVLDEMHATDDFNVRFMQNKEWALNRDRDHANTLTELAGRDPEYAPAAQSATAFLANPQSPKARVPSKDQPAIVENAAKQIAAERAAQMAQALSEKKQKAGKFVNSLVAATHAHLDRGTPDEKAWALHMLHHLTRDESKLIAHATDNPMSLHADVINAMAGDGTPVLKKIMQHAKTLLEHGN